MMVSRNPAYDPDPLCPITTVMAAFGLCPYDQRGHLLRYLLKNVSTGKIYDFEVNTLTNRWISRKDNMQGGLAQLVWLLKLPDVPDNPRQPIFVSDVYPVMRVSAYIWDHVHDRYPFTNIRYASYSLASVTDIQNREVLRGLTLHGISLKTAVNAGCKEAVIIDPRTKDFERMLALPCDGDSFYLFNGSCYRPLDKGGISVMGNHSRDQFCYVYENWHDYLAMWESCRRNHFDLMMVGSRHLIINGEQNFKAALDFLKTNPDFREVRCMLPKDHEGEDTYSRMFLKIHEVTGGSVSDLSGLYEGLPTMAATMKHPIPQCLAETFKRQDDEMKNYALGIKGAKSNDRMHGKSTEQVEHPELKIEPKGEPQVITIQPDKFRLKF